MIIVGELINASRKAIGTAIENQDAEAIKGIAQAQHENGAHYIDVNAGIFIGEESRYIQWLIKCVQEAVKAPCCIDSPDPAVIEAALAVHRGPAMVNSISLEKKRYDALRSVVAGTDLKVIALCMSDAGMPETADARLKIADKLVNGLIQNNVAVENIFVDPLVQSVSTHPDCGMEFLKAVAGIMTAFKGIHTICGLSNISYGLPHRALLNRTFMGMAIARGLDGAIVDPLNTSLMAAVYAAEALCGRDDFCGNYLAAYRAKKRGP